MAIIAPRWGAEKRAMYRLENRERGSKSSSRRFFTPSSTWDGLRKFAPGGEDPLDGVADFVAGVGAVVTATEEPVVVCLHVPDVRHDRQPHRFFVQALCRSAASDTVAIFEARVLGDRLLTAGRTVREEFPNMLAEALCIFSIELVSANRLALAATVAGRVVGQAFLLGLSQGLLFDQQPLSLIVLSSVAPL